MKVAAFELCRELYELSGWTGTHVVWHEDTTVSPMTCGYEDIRHPVHFTPAYDLGYLLRKLPRVLDGHEETFLHLRMVSSNLFGHCFYYEGGVLTTKSQVLEDAAAKLAIELFKQGIPIKAGDRE